MQEDISLADSVFELIAGVGDMAEAVTVKGGSQNRDRIRILLYAAILLNQPESRGSPGSKVQL